MTTKKKPQKKKARPKPPIRPKKMPPDRFGLAYSMIKIKEPTAGVRRVGELLHLSPTTVQGYLHDPNYIALIDTDLIQSVTDRESEKGIKYAHDIIEASYNLNAKRIQDLTQTKIIKHGDGREEEIEPTAENWEEARRISLQMLSIARTEAEVKRALTMLQINIDNRKQTINIQQCNKCMDDVMDEIIPCLCKKCQTKVIEVSMARQREEARV